MSLRRAYRRRRRGAEPVYGPAPDAELRLITCGGAFDAAASRCLSNIVACATAMS